ncbi:T9SS type A sorting domain-containing protein [Winogradskyella sp. 3972H.M.0a.05]|uniref:T9SS type A sorting domain-containing protein n=1 Tax=Winogradskyella sp. 3972H.M.0a.05 TaxID=2950277 RepID=UPI00339078F8
MTKKLLLFAVLFNLVLSANAQVEQVVYSYPEVDFIFMDGTTLYYSNSDEEIRYIDITQEDPTSILFNSTLDGPAGFEKKDGFLYVAEFFFGRIMKFDLSETNPSPIFVTSAGSSPNNLKFVGDKLYYTDNNGDQVLSYDLSDEINPVQDLGYVNNCVGIDYKDGYLYVSTGNQGGIQRLDLSDTNAEWEEIISGLGWILGIEFLGDELYIASVSGDSVIKVDITANPLVAVEVVGGLDNPNDIAFDGDIMYIAEDNFISRVDLSTLSIGEFNPINPISIVPNPAQDVISISNVRENTDYEIFDIRGRSLKKGQVFPNSNSVDVSTLSKGHYIISLNNGFVTKKLIKN